MLSSSKKILISGCGLSWGSQEKKTWVNALQSVGADIIDVGGPAVSNQWILNRAIDTVFHTPNIDYVIIQLTAVGKLDVEVDEIRAKELVDKDTLRNFTINGVWPSSKSTEHPAKAMWETWLYSPTLEIQDLYCKLILLHHWCQSKNIKLLVYQGYEIDWSEIQKRELSEIIKNIDTNFSDMYHKSAYYVKHDHQNYNTVPCLEFHLMIAEIISDEIDHKLTQRVKKLRSYYDNLS